MPKPKQQNTSSGFGIMPKATNAFATSSSSGMLGDFLGPGTEMMGGGGFDPNTGNFGGIMSKPKKEVPKISKLKESPFAGKNYVKPRGVITQEFIERLLRRSAITYNRAGLNVHALEQIFDLKTNTS